MREAIERTLKNSHEMTADALVGRFPLSGGPCGPEAPDSLQLMGPCDPEAPGKAHRETGRPAQGSASSTAPIPKPDILKISGFQCA